MTFIYRYFVSVMKLYTVHNVLISYVKAIYSFWNITNKHEYGFFFNFTYQNFDIECLMLSLASYSIQLFVLYKGSLNYKAVHLFLVQYLVNKLCRKRSILEIILLCRIIVLFISTAKIVKMTWN